MGALGSDKTRSMPAVSGFLTLSSARLQSALQPHLKSFGILPSHSFDRCSLYYRFILSAGFRYLI
jgi:hypothetical protein